MSDPHDTWTDTGRAWVERFGKGRLPLLPYPPNLDAATEDTRPVVGKILNPQGQVIKVVRHGPDKIPFGFQG